MKIMKIGWTLAAFFMLGVTLYFFDNQPNSDIWIFLTWGMLALSFPGGLVVSLAHSFIGSFFHVSVHTTYATLALEWLVYFGLGYLQWFRLFPFLFRRIRANSPYPN